MKRELTKYLNSLDEKGLKKEVKILYDKFDQVKQYYDLELGNSRMRILNEYKEKIKEEYFPKRGYGRASNRESKKVISEFKKISIQQKDVIELLLYRIEMMVKFTAEYGDIDEPFYNSLENGFKEACKLVEREKLKQYYRNYCQELVSRTADFGWGVSYNMKDIYKKYVD
jgi:hypothetical protein